ncbi:MAG: hypothetical protein IAE93_15670 [Ignavibacteria bacterium]|nr:hypothetical protein [Ignavibacteria bacterium]
MKIIIAIFLIIPSVVFSQQFLLIKERLPIDSVIILENAINSTKESDPPLIYLSKDYYVPDKEYDLAQPVVYTRKESSFISDCEVNYFFGNNDSIIQVILHTWDYRNEIKREDYIEGKYSEKVRLEMYNNKFDSIYSQVNAIMGLPNTSGEIKKEEKENRVVCKRNYEWSNEKCNIVVGMLWVEEYNFNSNLRIRLVVSLKN